MLLIIRIQTHPIRRTKIMMMIKDGNTYNVSIPTYYVESSSELSTIPSDAPAGTIAEVNDSNGFGIYMKNTSGDWNAL